MSEPVIKPLAITDLSLARGLAEQAESITSFSAVAYWCREAEDEGQRVTNAISAIAAQGQEINRAEAAVRTAHRLKPWYLRWFTTPPELSAIGAWREQAQSTTTSLESLASELRYYQSTFPKTSQEQKLRLKELRLEKKELSQKNREVGASMREVRRVARQRNADVGTGFEVFSSGRYRRFRRQDIRRDKERALSPYEDERASLTEQIALLDRQIIWLGRFHD